MQLPLCRSYMADCAIKPLAVKDAAAANLAAAGTPAACEAMRHGGGIILCALCSPACQALPDSAACCAEEKAADLKLLEAPPDVAGTGGKTKTLVPRPMDADDEEEDEGEESPSDDDEVRISSCQPSSPL